jgi:transposase-like protein/IS1 family transposase
MTSMPSCPYSDCACHDHGRAKVIAFGTYVTQHAGRRSRWRCQVCARTFGEATGTALAGLRSPAASFTHALALLSEGLSQSAIARVMGRAPSTIARWVAQGAAHARTFNAARTRPTEVGEVQMDELRVKGAARAREAWAYSAIEVFTRLWVGLRVNRRTLRSTREFVRQVSNALQDAVGTPIYTTDKMKYYEPSIRRVYENRLVFYQQVDTVYRANGIVRSTPTLVIGCPQALAELQAFKEPSKVNTSYIERLNLVQRSCCAMLRRRTPNPARLMSTVEDALELVRVHYNFIRCHASLRTSSGKQTPAMAAGLAVRPLTLLEICKWRPPSAWWRMKALEEAFASC